MKEGYDFDSPKVFSAMLKVPREEFVSKDFRHLAYKDNPIPIGFGQTISQPFTVAFMTDLLDLQGKEKVLEIGTGSGYQAAVLSLLAKEVYTIEIIKELAESAKKRLRKLKFENIKVKAGTGDRGWKSKAPFNRIIITAGVEGKIPKILTEQLSENGILVAPVGRGMDKVMTRYHKKKNGRLTKEEFGVFHFVAYIGS